MPLGVDESLHPAQCPLNPFALIGVFIERSQGSKTTNHVFTTRNRRKVLLSCLHQMRHLENQRVSCCKCGCTSFSPFSYNVHFSLITSKANVRRSLIFPWEILPWWHSSLLPMSGGRNTSNFGRCFQNQLQLSYSRDVRCPLALIWSILRSARFNLRYFFFFCSNLGLCSVLWCKWKKGNACPPQKGVKKTRKTHLPFSCVQELLVLHKTVWFRQWWKKL